MGNLPCCNPEEPTKDSALIIPGSSSDGSNVHQRHLAGDDHLLKSAQALHAPQGNGGIAGTKNASSNIISSNNNAANAFELEEQQRALYQEQERLERIVNDVGQDMVHVNGGVSVRGVNGMGGGYYDANYAADVWQALVPTSGRNGGGLIARCRDADVQLNKIPKGALENADQIVDVLSQGLQQQQNMIWNDDVVRLLDNLMTGNDDDLKRSGAGSIVRTRNGKMDVSVDVLADRFLASVFQEEGFEGISIVENV